MKHNDTNFTPFTQKEIAAIMAERKRIPAREQLYTSGGVKVYMHTCPR